MIGQAVHRGTAAGGSVATSEWVDKDAAQYASAGDDPESLESLGGFKSKVYGYSDLQPYVATPKFLRSVHIQTGYRVHFDFHTCARSVFWIHNETWNIWTHLFGFFYFLYLMVYAKPMAYDPRRASQFSNLDHVMYNGLLISAQACMLFSAVFHTFNCMSEEWSVRLYKLDLVGILGLILGSFANGLYYGFYCTPHVGLTYLAVLVVLIGTSAFFALASSYQHSMYTHYRVYSLTATVVFGLTPSVHWGLVASREAFSLFVYYLSGMFLLYMMGFIFYSSKIPERWSPGSFDLYLHSHQWWHVFVFLAAAVASHGFVKYASWRVATGCEAAL